MSSLQAYRKAAEWQGTKCALRELCRSGEQPIFVKLDVAVPVRRQVVDFGETPLGSSVSGSGMPVTAADDLSVALSQLDTAAKSKRGVADAIQH